MNGELEIAEPPEPEVLIFKFPDFGNRLIYIVMQIGIAFPELRFLFFGDGPF